MKAREMCDQRQRQTGVASGAVVAGLGVLAYETRAGGVPGLVFLQQARLLPSAKGVCGQMYFSSEGSRRRTKIWP